jgi:hypothetical protein
MAHDHPAFSDFGSLLLRWTGVMLGPGLSKTAPGGKIAFSEIGVVNVEMHFTSGVLSIEYIATHVQVKQYLFHLFCGPCCCLRSRLGISLLLKKEFNPLSTPYNPYLW